MIGDNCTGKSSILLTYYHGKGSLNDRGMYDTKAYLVYEYIIDIDKKTEFICKSLYINNKKILIRAYRHERITCENVEVTNSLYTFLSPLVKYNILYLYYYGSFWSTYYHINLSMLLHLYV